MIYCSQCIMPDTRPGIKFNKDGVCSACTNFAKRDNIDWNERWKKLEKICNKYRSKNGQYDCVIAVSSGKDSHFQTYMFKEVLGMHPLLVSVTDNFTHTLAGEYNFTNLQREWDCPVVVYHPKLATQKKLIREHFEAYLKPTLYIDKLIYSYPLHMAKNFGIKLLVYGEDISFTYGGKDDKEKWSAKSQINNGVADEVPGIAEADPMTVPPKLNGLDPIYLSYFVPWNSYENYKFAKTRGFKDLSNEWERTNHAEQFDQIDSIEYLMHPWLKYPKFGHTVATDYASKFIRYGMITRKEGIKLAKRDSKLDKVTLTHFCKWAGYSESQFYKIVDKFYNKDLFKKTIFGWKPKFKIGG